MDNPSSGAITDLQGVKSGLKCFHLDMPEPENFVGNDKVDYLDTNHEIEEEHFDDFIANLQNSVKVLFVEEFNKTIYIIFFNKV